MKSVKRQFGMTLLEILVVLVITAILSTMLVLRFASRGDGELQRDAERFSALLQQHCQDALLLGQVRGLSISPRGYKFWYFAGNQWFDASAGNRLYRAREWVSDWDLSLDINGQPMSLNSGQEIPQIICLADAQLPVFELQIGSHLQAADSRQLKRGPNGSISIHKSP